MPVKPIKELQPGEVIAGDVVSPRRVVLVRKGTTLSAALIADLRRHGIATVSVEAPFDERPPPHAWTEAELRAIGEAVARRFAHVEPTAGSAALQEAVRKALVAAPGPVAVAPEKPRGPLPKHPLDKIDIGGVIDRIEEIPTLSPVYEKLSALLASDAADAASVARVIEEDQGLTVRVLRLARSSVLARRAQVSTVSAAIVKLGFRAVQSMVLSTSALRALRRYSGPGFERLWRHGFAVGSASRLLALKLKLGEPEEAFTMGIVHDLGQLILEMQYQDVYEELIARAEQAPHVKLQDAERRVFGVDHMQLGYMLARRWRLPEPLVHAIRHHHEPEAARDHVATTSMVNIADALANALGLGGDGPARVTWPSARAWEVLRLDPEGLEEVCAETILAYRDFEDFYTAGHAATVPPTRPRSG
jgi:HD-like signal output (HDOD) protein